MHGDVEVVASVPDAFARVLAEAFGRRPGPRFTVFLSGGPTARACYEALADVAEPAGTARTGVDPGGALVDWSVVDVYWGDERCVPPDDPDANQRLAREALLDRVGPIGSAHPMTEGGDPEASARSYQELLAPLAAVDVVHLGMGPDGHTASLFPGAPALRAGPDELVRATADPSGTNPHPRLTVTLPFLARARLIVLTVSGAAKHAAFDRVVHGADLPAGLVRPAAGGRVLWLVDAAAAGQAADTRQPADA